MAGRVYRSITPSPYRKSRRNGRGPVAGHYRKRWTARCLGVQIAGRAEILRRDLSDGGGPSFGRRRPKSQFERFTTTLDRRLGTWQSAAEPAWNVTRGTGGHLVRLTYQSQFAKGAASEQFVWRMQTDGPALLGYHVNSPLLIAQ